MSTEELKKALGKRAKFLGNIVQSFENHNQVHFQSGYVAHKDDKLLLIEDVLDVLDDYVVVPRKQLEDLDKGFPSINSRKYYENGTVDYIKWATDVIRWRGKFQDFRFGLLEKELLEAT